MPTRVYLLAGQSNMAGGGDSSQLPEAWRQAPANLRLFEDGDFRPLVYRPRFGPEVGFARALGDQPAESPVVLCKVARGGANLACDWNPDGNTRSDLDEYRGPVYPLFIDEVRRLRERLNGDCTIAAMLWMQGERDSVIEPFANAYADNLAAFIGRVRDDLGCPQMPFVMGRVCPRVLRITPDGVVRNHAFRGVVRAAQDAVAAMVAKVRIAETDDLPVHDNLHFDAAGQVVLGQRFFDALD